MIAVQSGFGRRRPLRWVWGALWPGLVLSALWLEVTATPSAQRYFTSLAADPRLEACALFGADALVLAKPTARIDVGVDLTVLRKFKGPFHNGVIPVMLDDAVPDEAILGEVHLWALGLRRDGNGQESWHAWHLPGRPEAAWWPREAAILARLAPNRPTFAMYSGRWPEECSAMRSIERMGI